MSKNTKPPKYGTGKRGLVSQGSDPDAITKKQRVVRYEHNAMTHERMLDAGVEHGLPRRAATVAEFNNKRFLKIHYSPEVQAYLKTSGIATTWGLIEELVIKELQRRGYGKP